MCEKYQVNGQAAWSLLKKAERYDVRLMSSLSDEVTALMRLTKITDIAKAAETAGVPRGYIIPGGGKVRVVI